MINGSYTVSARVDAIRNGATLKTLRADNLSVDMTGSGEIKTSLSCFIGYDAELDLLNDHLCPFQTVNGVDYPLGEFIVAGAEESSKKKGWDIEAYDLGQIVRQLSTESRIRFAAGTTYLDAAQQLLTACGISRATVEPSALILPSDREDWEIGTSYLTIINTLLSEINYETLWFDRNGFARLRKIKQANVSNITKSYLPGEYSILMDEISKGNDTYSAYNVFTAVVSSPDGPPMISISVNDSPLSPLSTVNRGRRICAPVEYLDAAASQEVLDSYADNLRAASMLSFETVDFETAAIPTHEIGEIIALGDGIYQETGWSLSLGYGGSYTHKARRVMMA